MNELSSFLLLPTETGLSGEIFALALIVGLWGACLPPANGAPLLPATDSLSARAVAFDLRYGASPMAPPARDRWLARDKAKHVVFSGLWTLSTQYLLVTKADWSENHALPVSIASSATVGLLKEAYDASQPSGHISGRDLVADAVGIGLAAGIVLL